MGEMQWKECKQQAEQTAGKKRARNKAIARMADTRKTQHREKPFGMEAQNVCKLGAPHSVFDQAVEHRILFKFVGNERMEHGADS